MEKGFKNAGVAVCKATLSDIPVISDILSDARKTMRENGNFSQWPEGYPSREMIASDIERGCGYLCMEDGRVKGYFALIEGPDPTYAKIYEGSWIDTDTPYGVIHRICSARGAHGILDLALEKAFSAFRSVRIDTHRDNSIMIGALERRGFSYCGIIHLLSGDERLAYQKVIPSQNK